MCLPPCDNHSQNSDYTRTHQHSRVGVEQECGIGLAGRPYLLVVLEPQVGGRRDALMVPTAQLHQGARHGRTGDLAGGLMGGH